MIVTISLEDAVAFKALLAEEGLTEDIAIVEAAIEAVNA